MDKRRIIEKEINSIVGELFKKWVGKGPKHIKTKVFEDIAVIKFQRYPIPLIDHLLECEEGREILVKMNRKIF